jgi:hypothetical protein
LSLFEIDFTIRDCEYGSEEETEEEAEEDVELMLVELVIPEDRRRSLCNRSLEVFSEECKRREGVGGILKTEDAAAAADAGNDDVDADFSRCSSILSR